MKLNLLEQMQNKFQAIDQTLKRVFRVSRRSLFNEWAQNFGHQTDKFDEKTDILTIPSFFRFDDEDEWENIPPEPKRDRLWKGRTLFCTFYIA